MLRVSPHTQIHVMWCRDYINCLGKHVNMLRFLNISSSFFSLFFGSRRARTGWTDFDDNTPSDVFSARGGALPFGGHD